MNYYDWCDFYTCEIQVAHCIVQTLKNKIYLKRDLLNFYLPASVWKLCNKHKCIDSANKINIVIEQSNSFEHNWYYN